MVKEANVIDKINAANKANIVEEAHVIDEIVGAIEADDTNEAIDAKEAEADEADDADKAIVVDETKANVADKAKANVVDETKADEADLTNVTDKANYVDKAGVFIKMPLLLPFSLTKFSAIFAEVKEFFGINNNQLGSWNSCSLNSRNGTCRVENVFLSWHSVRICVQS